MTDFLVKVDRSITPPKFSFPKPFNVAVPFIDRHIQENRGEKIAIQCADQTITYGCLAEQVNRCGNALLNQGVNSGDRLMMVVKDTPAFFYLFWGAIKAGVIPVPVNTLLRVDDYAFMIEKTACQALCYSSEYMDEIEPAIVKSNHMPHVVLVEGASNHRSISLETVMESASPELLPFPATEHDDCFWLFSSGSTGKPKAAVHRHRDMVVTSELYGVGCLNITENDIFYSAAKLFFAYGLGNAMTLPLWIGARLILDWRKPTPEITFNNMARYQPSLYFGVPTLYSALLNSYDELDSKPNLSSLRACVSAGEALPADILRRWRERIGIDILDGIGSTEALHIFITNLPNKVVPGASGRLVPGYQARILDENDNLVMPGTIGRLLVKGPSSAGYYWQDPERTAATMKGEWLETGDTYLQNEDGVFVYCGRNDDMMKVGGIWCSPFEIEAKLVEHPAVLEAAVVAREDSAGLVKPAAFVVLKDPKAKNDAVKNELILYVKSGLARYKFPRWITFVDVLPKTATGKIQRFKLRAECT
ncbi:MAG: Benzoate--CoA ligase [Alphaproteobacteria bacterium MarineAlpha9_Bin7]|nr:MAG: Benzoate--CoA ligase [Alphaproteobacteria bacterium MarineAlpha9_Bin7]